MALKTLKGRLKRADQFVANYRQTSGGAFSSFYYTKPWLALRAAIINERGPHCQVCGATGKVIADHIIELKDGGAFLDKRNIQLLCAPCHVKKTAEAARQRAKWTPPPRAML